MSFNSGKLQISEQAITYQQDVQNKIVSGTISITIIRAIRQVIQDPSK